MTIAEKVNEVINEYVHEHGTNIIMTDVEIHDLVNQIYVIKKQSFQITDYCYNRYSARLEDFGKKNRLFEQLGDCKYRLLGSNYSYNGVVFHKLKQGGYEYIVGEWNSGKFSFSKEKDQLSKQDYYAEIVLEAKKIDEQIDNLNVAGEERNALVKVRVNQSIFRERLISRYEKCCLCGVSSKSLLIASHIKPWAKCEPEEKLDLDNGFLLCPNHDKLFDSGLISFDSNGDILISEELLQNDKIFMNVANNMHIDLSERNRDYLEYHRRNVFR